MPVIIGPTDIFASESGKRYLSIDKLVHVLENITYYSKQDAFAPSMFRVIYELEIYTDSETIIISGNSPADVISKLVRNIK